jgi:hypothetical protein
MSSEFPPKLTPKIILEGTRLTHKTDIAFALNEHPRIVGPRKYRYHSPLVSAEWCAFTNIPWGRGLINFAEQEEDLALETYRTWLHLFELLKYYSWIVDRFHLSTQVYQKSQGRTYDFTWLEQGLQKLGFALVVCTRSEESFPRARAARLAVSGNPGQYGNLNRFIAEQEELRAAAARSLLPHLQIDVSDDDVQGACGRIADWLQEKRLLGFYDAPLAAGT